MNFRITTSIYSVVVLTCLLFLALFSLATHTQAIAVPSRAIEAASILSPGYQRRALPTQIVTYTHVITNTQTETATFTLEAMSRADWVVSLMVAQTPGSAYLPVQMGPETTTTVQVNVTIPSTVLSGTIAHTVVTATSLSTPTLFAVVTDTTLVYRVPGLALSPAQHSTGQAGETLTFAHTLTNTGAITERVTLASQSAQGWQVALLESINATQTLHSPLHLSEAGTAHFVVSATIPETATAGVLDHIIVMASSLVHTNVHTTVTDTVTVPGARTYALYLPLVRKYGAPRVKLGVDYAFVVTRTDVISQDFPLVKAMGAEWVRVLLPWYKIETSPGVYHWEDFDPVFNQLANLDQQAMVALYGAPAWAAEQSCGPLSDTVALESLLDVLIPHYADITGVWEFINEPEGKEPHGYGPVIGCWGLAPKAYAEQLPVFYWKVRALDPSSRVFFGGLAYDGWNHFERTFLDQALAHGAGPYFDGLSFHYYPINPEFPTMAHKANEIRDIMAAHGINDKLIWASETAMWVNDHPAALGSLEIQRNFIVQDFAQGFSAGLDNIIWFGVSDEPWRTDIERWLIDSNHQPGNGYTTFQHLAERVAGLVSQGAYTNVPEDVEVYHFKGAGRQVYVLWSNTVSQTVTLPAAGEVWLINREGDQQTPLPIQAGQVTFEIGPSPVFVESRSVQLGE